MPQDATPYLDHGGRRDLYAWANLRGHARAWGQISATFPATPQAQAGVRATGLRFRSADPARASRVHQEASAGGSAVDWASAAWT